MQETPPSYEQAFFNIIQSDEELVTCKRITFFSF